MAPSLEVVDVPSVEVNVDEKQQTTPLVEPPTLSNHTGPISTPAVESAELPGAVNFDVPALEAKPDEKQQIAPQVETTVFSEDSIPVAQLATESAELPRTKFELEDHPIDSPKPIKVSPSLRLPLSILTSAGRNHWRRHSGNLCWCPPPSESPKPQPHDLRKESRSRRNMVREHISRRTMRHPSQRLPIGIRAEHTMDRRICTREGDPGVLEGSCEET